MMKKNGFTLAEVLITLAIIGVVATLTLPALMTNTGEQQAVTAFKKGINTLTEAAQMNSSIAGFDYASLTTTTDSDDAQSLIGLLRNRTSYNSEISGTTSDEAKAVAGSTGNFVAFFRDGSALMFNRTNATSSGTTGGTAANELQADGLPYGIAAVYDTNGAKGPNLLSNCSQNTVLTAGSENAADNWTEGQTYVETCKKENRVIKDQFGVRLRGSKAFPNGPAAYWAFNN